MTPTGFPRLTSATVCRNGLYAANWFQQFTNESMCLPGTSWGWHGLDWVMLPWQRFASASCSSLQWRVRCCRPSSSQSPQSVHSPQPDEQRQERTERVRAWDWKIQGHKANSPLCLDSLQLWKTSRKLILFDFSCRFWTTQTNSVPNLL